MKIKNFLLVTLLLNIFFTSLIFSEEKRISTIFTTIEYKNVDNLERFFRKIKGVYPLKNFDEILNYNYGRSPFSSMYRKVDEIVLRVEDILDMHPVAFKVKIKILSTKEEMESFFIREFGYKKKDVIAFYIPSENRIYVRLDKINSHILAHEISHAVINKNFVIKPSEKIQELLCHYVDVNLTRKNLKDVPY